MPLMHATPSSMISLAKTGILGWTLRVEAPLTATSIQVFLTMIPQLTVGFSAYKPQRSPAARSNRARQPSRTFAFSAARAPPIASAANKVKGERVNENALALPLKPKSSVASADVIQLGGVVADHLVLLAFIDRVDPLRYELFRARPRRIGVRIIRRPHQPVRAVLLAGEADVLGLELEGPEHLPLHIVTRLERQLHRIEVPQAVVRMIEPVAEVRHPRDVVFGGDQLETRVALEHAAEHQFRE